MQVLFSQLVDARWVVSSMSYTSLSSDSFLVARHAETLCGDKLVTRCISADERDQRVSGIFNNRRDSNRMKYCSRLET